MISPPPPPPGYNPPQNPLRSCISPEPKACKRHVMVFTMYAHLPPFICQFDSVYFLRPALPFLAEVCRDLFLPQLNQELPSRTIGHCWDLVYSTFEHGFSLKTIYRRMEDCENPVLLVIMDDQHKVNKFLKINIIK